jgi:hypothetical protein
MTAPEQASHAAAPDLMAALKESLRRPLKDMPVVNLRCSGCGWRGAASGLAMLNDAASRHDDSPHRQHIVTLDPPGVWPMDDEAFQALLPAPGRSS